MGFLLLGLSSLSVTTYAWFSSQRTSNVGINSIKVAGSDDVRIYEYKDNFTLVGSTRVFAGWDYGKRSTRAFHDFDTDFQSVTELEFSDLTPNSAYTFAFTMTRGIYSDLRFTLEGFICQTYHDRLGGGSIYLSEAIDMYMSAYFYTDTGTDTLDQVATAHLHNTDLTDRFTSSDQRGDAMVLFDEDYVNEHMLVFMTIVASDSPSTYYYYDETQKVYSKDSSGDSNVYKNLSINFQPLQIKGENV